MGSTHFGVRQPPPGGKERSSLALAWAEVVGATAIVIGVNALDYSGYPDCRPEYLEAFERMADARDEGRRRRRAPAHSSRRCCDCRRRRSSTRALALGLDYGLTHSCYDPRVRRQAVRPLRQLPAARDEASPRPACPIPCFADVRDRAPLLHRSLSHRVRCRASSSVATSTAAPASCSIAPPSIRRPAASRSTPGRSAARASSTSSTKTTARSCTSSRRGSVAAGDTAAAVHGDASTGRGASITCSSTPGSTCCRRRSIASVGVRTESFHLGADSSTIDLAREADRRRDRARRRRSEPGRLGRPSGHDPVRRRRGSRGACRCARSRSATGTLRLDRRRRTSIVSACGGTHVRSHRRDRHHRRVGLRSGSAAARGSSSCAAAARSRAHRALRDTCPRSRQRLSSVRPRNCRQAIERLQGEARSCARRLKDFDARLATHEADALARARRRIGRVPAFA